MSAIPTVDDYMARDLIVFGPGDDIHAAAQQLLDKRISGAPVVDRSGRLIGVLSKKDCFEVLYSTSYYQEWGGRVEDYMSTEVTTIDSGTDIIKAADIFRDSAFRRFPIVKNGRMIGQISRADLLRALEEHWASVATGGRGTRSVTGGGR